MKSNQDGEIQNQMKTTDSVRQQYSLNNYLQEEIMDLESQGRLIKTQNKKEDK